MNIKTKDDRKVFTIHQNGDVRWLEPCAFEGSDEVRIVIATRFGGASSGIYSSMNFSYSQGDDPDLVRENYILFGKAIGVPAGTMVTSQQTHTVNLRYCTEEDCGKGAVRERDYTDVDGLYTDRKRLPLVISFADCVPVFIYDPVKRVIAAVHSGWRGTVGNIVSEVIGRLHSQYGTDPADLKALIGPSICADCYEVDEPVRTRFAETYTAEELERIILPPADPESFGHYQLDLWEANRINLLNAGVRDDQITVTNLCTCCNPDLIFSHRATNGRRGVTVGLIEML